MTERVLVTGGAGFIGSHLVDALLASGRHVRVYDNLEPQIHGELRENGQWPDYVNRGAEYVLGDVRDRDALQRAMVDVDVVFHLAARVGVGQSMYEIESYVDVNSRGTANLLDILVNEPDIRSRVRRLVVASSMSNYGEGKYMCPTHGVVFPESRPVAQLARQEWELRCACQRDDGSACGAILTPLPTDEATPIRPGSIYAITKKDQEEMCLVVGRTYDIPVVALRFYNTYGSRQALSNPYTGPLAIFSTRILNGKPPLIFEDGKQTRDFVHVSDLVQANVLAMDHPDAIGRIFNVGSGRSISLLDVGLTLCEFLETPLRPEIAQQFRAGDIRHGFPDLSQLERLGYRSRVPFEDGVAEVLAWVQSQAMTDNFDQAKDELIRRGLTV